MIAEIKLQISNWKSITYEKDGKVVETEQVWGSIELEISEDGIVFVSLLGVPGNGTWKYNDDTKSVTVTTDQFTDFELTEEDGSLYFDFSDTKVKLDRAEE